MEINQCLARIDLTQDSDAFTACLEQETVRQGMSVPLYILISTCQNKLLDGARRLSQAQGGLYWILPLHQGADPIIASDQKLTVLPWITAV